MNCPLRFLVIINPQFYFMTNFLKYMGKGLWMPINKSDITASDKVRNDKKKVRSRTKSTIEDIKTIFFEQLNKDIQKNGYRSIKVSTFLQHFGIQKRSVKNVIAIRTELSSQGLYSLPEFSVELKLDSTIRIYNYPVRQLGDLFQRERDLENYVEQNQLYKDFNIQSVIRQHSPNGTKDKLDFKGDCDNEEIVVLELKNAGGGKSAVEQVLRYAGILQIEYPGRTIRQILVTGIQNYETALAIRGMLKEQRELFEWYLYKYNKDSFQFEFVRVTNEEIEFQGKSVIQNAM